MAASVTVVYRTMSAEGRDKPRPVLSPHDLGCRVGIDVKPSPTGVVGAARPEGMSAFDDPIQMPPHLRPAAAGGTGNRPIWRLRTALLSDALTYHVTRGSHVVIAPAQPMALADYTRALEATADLWELAYV